MNYPKHKYSGHVDQEFSFSNRVYPSKVDLVNNLKNMRCDGGLMLEPRLQEYLKKKKYYRDTNIEPCIKPESEFQITSRDKKALRAFLKGRKDIYKNDKFNQFKQDKPKKKQYFPSKTFRNNDSRVPELKQENKNKPANMGMFAPEIGEAYFEGPQRELDEIMDFRDLTGHNRSFSKPIITMDDEGEIGGPQGYHSMGQRFVESLPSQQSWGGSDNTYELFEGKGFDIDDTRFDPRSDPRIYPGPEKYPKCSSQYRVSGDPDPRNKFMINDLTKKNSSNNGQFSSFDNSNQNNKLLNGKVSDILKKQKRYGEINRGSFSEKSDMDFKNKMVIPRMGKNPKKDLNTANYRMMPYFHTNEEIKDSNLEDTLIRGMPYNASKRSYGYRQPEENYFQYLDEDFQNPDNSVEPWMRGGESTRRDNKMLAKQKYYRDVY